MEKELPIYRLDIVEDLESNVEVDFVALVDRPAIEKSFLAFQDSYSDYPESVSNNPATTPHIIRYPKSFSSVYM